MGGALCNGISGESAQYYDHVRDGDQFQMLVDGDERLQCRLMKSPSISYIINSLSFSGSLRNFLAIILPYKSHSSSSFSEFLMATALLIIVNASFICFTVSWSSGELLRRREVDCATADEDVVVCTSGIRDVKGGSSRSSFNSGYRTEKSVLPIQYLIHM